MNTPNLYTRKSLALSLILIFHLVFVLPAKAQKQSNYQLIEQEIRHAEASLKTTEEFIKKVLWQDVPTAQTQTAQEQEKAEAISAELEQLSAEIDATQADLIRARNQLERSQRVLQINQQKLTQAQAEVQRLNSEQQILTSDLAEQTRQITQYQQQLTELEPQIQQSNAEVAQLSQTVTQARQQVELRETQAQQLELSEAQYQEEIASKLSLQKRQNRETQRLRRQLDVIKSKIASEQARWAKVDQQIKQRDEKRTTTEQQISATGLQTQNSRKELLQLKATLALEKQKTINIRGELSDAKQQLAQSKKNLRLAQQTLNTAKSELDDENDLKTNETTLQQKLISEINLRKAEIQQLQRNEADIQAEIMQLNKLIEIKNQSIAPLKEKTSALQQKQKEILTLKDTWEQRVKDTSKTLVTTEQKYQALADELRQLETQQTPKIDPL